MKQSHRLLIMRTWSRFAVLGLAELLCFVVSTGNSGIAVASVMDSKHNFSSTGPGLVKATTETQICVFCHTPHGANQKAGAPLWNRALSTATYVPYFSISMDANPLPGPPGASSKVCLSCHDGTLAIGTVGALNGKSGVNITMSGTGAGGVIPDGAGENTGYTRNIGTELSNDHPISFNYDATLGGPTGTDGELRTPPVTESSTVIVGNRASGVNPIFPLESNQVQCITCHDPHLATSVSLKFLRGNRLQNVAPLGGLFVSSSDITCLACHDKAGTAWSNSAHANETAADETYLNASAALNEFPLGTPVWQASCLACHDTHAVQGSRRLLREGTDSLSSPKSGGNPAIEQTCYQCHSSSLSSILSQISPVNDVPDIMSDFALTIRMPINQEPEKHNIGGSFNDSTSEGSGHLANGNSGRCNTAADRCGKDFMESEAVLGKVSAGGSLTNRHVECTDCHQPHRATKNRLFNANSAAPDAAGTHKHAIAAGDIAPHNNLASGSLRGINGVEPIYTSAEFGIEPNSFDVKRGDGGVGAPTVVNSTYVTREYQICLKCHSNYAYDNSPQALGYYVGGTLQSTNGLFNYINDAMEFQAPIGQQGAPFNTTDSGASSGYSANNYRSWHPVMDVTGRTAALRGNASPNLWRAPWNGSDTDGGSTIVTAIGTQTMYCSDCHGSATNLADGVEPVNGENGNSWGPHGSTQNFLLKGEWLTDTPPTISNDTLCFRCHEYNQYANPAASPSPAALPSGFGGIGNDVYGVPISNLHQRHAYYTTQGGTLLPPTFTSLSTWPVAANRQLRCTMCHTGTAHGWKNKDFLVNLNDLGPEINLITGGTPPAGALGGEIAPGPIALTAGANVPKGSYVPSSMAPIPSGYSNGPYYRGSLLYLAATGFKASGNWVKTDCTGCH